MITIRALISAAAGARFMQDSDKPGDSEKLPRGHVIAFVLAKLEDGMLQQCARAVLNAAVIIPYSVRDAHRHVATNAKRTGQAMPHG